MNLNGSDAAPRAGNLMHLDDAHALIAEDDRGKWDAQARREDIVVKDGCLAFALDNHGEHWEQLTPTNWATGQLCARLGIPANYFRKCPALLQDVQANYWLKASGEKGQHEQWLVRAKHGTLRAILSEQYSPLDNATLMECLTPLLGSRYRVDWFGLADESLHLRIIDPGRAREVLPDDALSVGVHIANSEVGFRAVTVDALVYRLVCSNGLIRLVKGKSLLRQRHIHVAPARFVAALEEAITNALGEADSFIEQLRRATFQPVSDVEETVKRIGERWNLADSTREAILTSLQREPAGQSETVYGLVNAVTNAAQRLSDEERYDMEVLAGRLVEQAAAEGNKVFDGKLRLRQQPVHPAPELQDQEVEVHESAETQEDGVRWSAVELAQQMFDAEIIGREPSRGREGVLV